MKLKSNYPQSVHISTPVLTLSTFMNNLVPVALELNKTNPETSEDFENSNRTGQCYLAFGDTFGGRIGIQFIPEHDHENKIRYDVVANNKFSYLLESGTICQTSNMPEKRIFKGGIKRLNYITAVSGFHPKIDEAIAILCYSFLYGAPAKMLAEIFENDFVMVLFPTVEHCMGIK